MRLPLKLHPQITAIVGRSWRLKKRLVCLWRRLNTYYQKNGLMLKQNKQKNWQQILGRKKILNQQIMAIRKHFYSYLITGCESLSLSQELGV